MKKYKSTAQTTRISKAIIEIIQGLISQSEIQTVEWVLQSLKDQKNEPWWDLFDSKATGPSENGNFQLAPCVDDSSSQVVMGLASFCFTASAREDRWMWFDYSSTSINLFKSTQVVTLDEDVYEQLRQPVIEKLGKKAITFIGDLQI